MQLNIIKEERSRLGLSVLAIIKEAIQYQNSMEGIRNYIITNLSKFKTGNNSRADMQYRLVTVNEWTNEERIDVWHMGVKDKLIAQITRQ